MSSSWKWPIHISFVDLLFFSFCFIMKGQQKLSSFFMLLKKMAVEPEKHKDGLEKDGKAARSQFSDVSCTKFQYHSLTWPKPTLKCHVGHIQCMYDPFWLISRLNTALPWVKHLKFLDCLFLVKKKNLGLAEMFWNILDEKEF